MSKEDTAATAAQKDLHIFDTFSQPSSIAIGV